MMSDLAILVALIFILAGVFSGGLSVGFLALVIYFAGGVWRDCDGFCAWRPSVIKMFLQNAKAAGL